MSTKAKTETVLTDSAGGLRSEPGGRAERASRLRAAPGAAGRCRQHAQRVDAQDAADRAGASRDQDAARPQGQLRAAAGQEGAAALRGLRRQDPRALLARVVDA